MRIGQVHGLRNPMTRVLPAVGLMVTVCCGAARAQSEVKVTGMLSGADQLIEDLEYLVNDLAGERQVWEENVLPNIEIFLEGVSRTRPVRVDVLMDPAKTQEQYISYIPVDDSRREQSNFLNNNLNPLGITDRQRGRTLYQLRGEYEGYLQFAHAYAAIAEEQKQIPGDMPDPVLLIKPYVDRGFDVAMRIANNADGIEDRKSALKPLRDNTMAAVKPKDDEKPEEFELRKLTIKHQLDNIERYFVEARLIEGGWTTDVAGGVASGEGKLEALEGTTLSATLRKMGTLASTFSEIALAEDAMASGRIMFPVDEFRQAHLKEFYATLRPVIRPRLAEVNVLDPAQLDAADAAVQKAIEMFEDGLALGFVDGYFEATPVDDLYAFHAGIRSPEPQKVEEIAKLIPQIDTYAKLEMAFAEFNDVMVHKVTLSGDQPVLIKYFFGELSEIYFGVGKDVVWLGAGPTALDKLKASIAKAAEGNTKTSETILELNLHTLPLLTAADRQFKPNVIPKLRDAGLNSLKPTDDFFRLNVFKVEEAVKGEMRVETGILRTVGELIANFAKENL